MLIRKILNQLQTICNKKLVVGIGDGSRREQEKSRGSPLLPFNLGWKILTLFEHDQNSMANENHQDK